MDPLRPDDRDEPTEPWAAPHREQERVFVFWEGGAASHVLPAHGAFKIGRSRHCDVRIDHASVSREHAVLHTGDCIEIEDLESSNGTRVNGERLAPRRRRRLARGAIIEVGLATLLVQGTDAIEGAPKGAPSGAPADAAHAPTMNRLYRLVDMIAESRISVIVLGETGVGKEVMAETIHARSPRASQPLVRIHCAAMPEGLLESELFGFERGAFTSAVQSKPGLIESAHGGTLFLDEAGEMPMVTQAKLLRVIESREVMRLGALKPTVVDVRFVCATNRDLEQLVAAGRFRRDLYYRLNGITITVPPLRNRRSEIPELARTFVERTCEAMGRRPVAIAPEAQKLLKNHDWPGNIRELKNVIERAVVLARGETIGAAHLALPVAASLPTAERTPAVSPAKTPDLRRDLEELERRRIVEALEQSAGNQTKAAKLLGISRRALLVRLDAYGLPRPRKTVDE